ncbi:unnamed protein product [Meloidogyne enterolobii]|uniref:Uncharacterized protein n=1 Tax=Meloidogyne enterolobii TaxID=390850 RepID=A0ACB1B6T0_MELEN
MFCDKLAVRLLDRLSTVHYKNSVHDPDFGIRIPTRIEISYMSLSWDNLIVRLTDKISVPYLDT